MAFQNGMIKRVCFWKFQAESPTNKLLILLQLWRCLTISGFFLPSSLKMQIIILLWVLKVNFKLYLTSRLLKAWKLRWVKLFRSFLTGQLRCLIGENVNSRPYIPRAKIWFECKKNDIRYVHIIYIWWLPFFLKLIAPVWNLNI